MPWPPDAEKGSGSGLATNHETREVSPFNGAPPEITTVLATATAETPTTSRQGIISETHDRI